jgi:hypothetical protein
MEYYITLALKFAATIYGFGEHYCGDYDQEPQPCEHGAITASGEIFDPNALTAAVPAPRNYVMRRATEIKLKKHNGKCITVRVNDKKNERFIGNSGLDLTPAVVKKITGSEAPRYWGGRVEQCNLEGG